MWDLEFHILTLGMPRLLALRPYFLSTGLTKKKKKKKKKKIQDSLLPNAVKARGLE